MTRPAGIAESTSTSRHAARRRLPAPHGHSAVPTNRPRPRQNGQPAKPTDQNAACCLSGNSGPMTTGWRSAPRTIRDWRRHRARKGYAPARGRLRRTSLAAAARSPRARRTAARSKREQDQRAKSRSRSPAAPKPCAMPTASTRRGQDAKMDQRADAEAAASPGDEHRHSRPAAPPGRTPSPPTTPVGRHQARQHHLGNIGCTHETAAAPTETASPRNTGASQAPADAPVRVAAGGSSTCHSGSQRADRSKTRRVKRCLPGIDHIRPVLEGEAKRRKARSNIVPMSRPSVRLRNS